MTLPTQDTVVLYPSGSVRNAATVLHVEVLPGGRVAVLLDATSVHPVDAGWPDQGADAAVLRIGEIDHTVVDAIVGATDGAELHLGRDIPVGKGTEGWAFVVVHVLESGALAAEGDPVRVSVDAGARLRTSAGHTGCHVASLALNRAVADRWKKEIRADGLGNPDFDGVAIDVSLIRENGSTDTYRLGKSLRKKGFVTEGLADDLAQVQDAINAALAGWVASGAAVRIERDGDLLTDRRYWVCELPEQTVRIPCGGTHVDSLAELGAPQVLLSLSEVDGTSVLTMETSVG
ncbi:alanyl-tRNA synthetase [Cryobacterium psychrotolerans]|uniref:Alanyl-tRNA synthetase n=1 Tax=Cryobacterium psychrotolerans TaxID=386301 RepID=A0A1G9A9M5_9MICO|nr:MULTISPECIES: metal-dependent hydrolase [Cryobacterium]TFD49067.1 metal-dependent hydrolase [Cryobacterium sp. TMT1-2-1]TFD89742.1 metal-dependent hydrolase [Cryobacterium psychrotolerans]SDK24049.1 alanyl-tRNA synthetase [Cryobacterium psychrotolerans]